MTEAYIIRQYGEKSTLSAFVLLNEGKVIFTCNTLELTYKGNQREISCIPEGTYNVKPRVSKKYGSHFILENVPNRTAILIHVGNKVEDTEGCILVGVKSAENFISESKDTLAMLRKFAPKGFKLTILNGDQSRGIESLPIPEIVQVFSFLSPIIGSAINDFYKRKSGQSAEKAVNKILIDDTLSDSQKISLIKYLKGL